MIPTRVGQRAPGGRFAGIMRISNRVHAIVIAPKWTETHCIWKTNNSLTTGPCSRNDGLANTRAMDPSKHPAAKYCLGLGVDGCNDYYLLSYNELEVCYRNLKPTPYENFTKEFKSFKPPLTIVPGVNRSSIPLGKAYSETNPKQTIVTAFCDGNTESFDSSWNWTSTEFSGHNVALIWLFFNGRHHTVYKTGEAIVRAARRIYIDIE